MKRFAFLLLLVPFTLTLAACDVPPKTDVADMQAAIDAAVAQGAEKYAPDQLKLINDQKDEVLAEIAKQDGKFIFKNYQKARLLANKAKTEATTLKERLSPSPQGQSQG